MSFLVYNLVWLGKQCDFLLVVVPVAPSAEGDLVFIFGTFPWLLVSDVEREMCWFLLSSQVWYETPVFGWFRMFQNR